LYDASIGISEREEEFGILMGSSGFPLSSHASKWEELKAFHLFKPIGDNILSQVKKESG
jgi:hypothetical protein